MLLELVITAPESLFYAENVYAFRCEQMGWEVVSPVRSGWQYHLFNPCPDAIVAALVKRKRKAHEQDKCKPSCRETGRESIGTVDQFWNGES
jgi:hypothetical protein